MKDGAMGMLRHVVRGTPRSWALWIDSNLTAELHYQSWRGHKMAQLPGPIWEGFGSHDQVGAPRAWGGPALAVHIPGRCPGAPQAIGEAAPEADLITA